MNTPRSEIIIYQNPNGNIKIDVRLEEENVWLTQKLTCLRQKGMQVAELFQVKPQNITMHLKNIFKECELEENSVCRNFRHTANDGKNYDTKYYNLDVIISVG